MPKETIYCSENPPTSESQWALEISWMRDAYVELGVADPTREGRHHLCSSSCTDVAAHRREGLFIQMGRHEINKVIRALRRARDQAYGKDE